jgi:hypothetical protein
MNLGKKLAPSLMSLGKGAWQGLNKALPFIPIAKDVYSAVDSLTGGNLQKGIDNIGASIAKGLGSKNATKDYENFKKGFNEFIDPASQYISKTSFDQAQKDLLNNVNKNLKSKYNIQGAQVRSGKI